MPDLLAAEEIETLPKAQTLSEPEMRCDVLVIGAGPTGLACAIEAQRIGLKVIVVDKGCLVNSLFHYPAGMLFFTTPELLEIGDVPFSTAHQKPTREEALEYYRKVAEHYHLNIRQYQNVERVDGSDGNFTAGIGVPTLDGLGAVGEGAHAPHESVVAAELPRRSALLAGLIEALD